VPRGDSEDEDVAPSPGKTKEEIHLPHAPHLTPTPYHAPFAPPAISRRAQIEQDRVDAMMMRISEAHRSRSVRAQAAQVEALANQAYPEDKDAALVAIVEPSSYLRALRGEDKSLWEQAMRSEYESYLFNGAYMGPHPVSARHACDRILMEVQAQVRLQGEHLQIQGTPSGQRGHAIARFELGVRSNCEVHGPQSGPCPRLSSQPRDRADGCCYTIPQCRRGVSSLHGPTRGVQGPLQ